MPFSPSWSQSRAPVSKYRVLAVGPLVASRVHLNFLYWKFQYLHLVSESRHAWAHRWRPRPSESSTTTVSISVAFSRAFHDVMQVLPSAGNSGSVAGGSVV